MQWPKPSRGVREPFLCRDADAPLFQRFDRPGPSRRERAHDEHEGACVLIHDAGSRRDARRLRIVANRARWQNSFRIGHPARRLLHCAAVIVCVSGLVVFASQHCSSCAAEEGCTGDGASRSGSRPCPRTGGDGTTLAMALCATVGSQLTGMVPRVPPCHAKGQARDASVRRYSYRAVRGAVEVDALRMRPQRVPTPQAGALVRSKAQEDRAGKWEREVQALQGPHRADRGVRGSCAVTLLGAAQAYDSLSRARGVRKGRAERLRL